MRKAFIAGFFIVLFFGFVGFARADIYKFIDEDGVLHFTNVPNDSAYKWVMPEVHSEMRVLTARQLQVRYDAIIWTVSRRYDVDASLVKAVIEAESDFDSRAISRAGAVGLMQLMPETASELGVTDLYNPMENIEAGVRHLKRLLMRFSSSVPLALAAYNAGESKVRKYGAIPPFKETRGFVDKVLEYQKKYTEKFGR